MARMSGRQFFNNYCNQQPYMKRFNVLYTKLFLYTYNKKLNGFTRYKRLS